jgi:hypothetical protein
MWRAAGMQGGISAQGRLAPCSGSTDGAHVQVEEFVQHSPNVVECHLACEFQRTKQRLWGPMIVEWASRF